MPIPDTVQATDPQYQDIWRAAIQEYEQNTKVVLPGNLNSIDDVRPLVEQHQNQFADFRNKMQLGPIVKDVLSGVGSFADVVGTGVGIVSGGIVCIYEFADRSVVRYTHPQRQFLQPLACCSTCVTLSSPSENNVE